MEDLNVVMLLCRLTRDPELRSLPSGTSVCSLRVAFSSSVKNGAGAWEDRPNYCDVTVWGAQGENCAKYLAKGRQIAVRGRLQWREWKTDDGAKRQALDVVADRVQFLAGKEDGADGGSQWSAPPSTADGARGDIPVDNDFSSLPASGADEDIPF